MYTIDILLKYSPMPISVQRKEQEDAKAVFQGILEAMKRDHPELIHLTCDKQPEKEVAVFSDQINAVVISEKSATTSGRTPGFFSNEG
ncbi:hypothetical protein PN462_00460 [Spirulina sp. CS-785/01]|uniref:hypothetical protein n=1 Tax=Spirulina sp. CS-785/01 TaxID=3021716 RepID=UPI00232FA468|nr:hypothetical protein [Spirulina sp. CS-785/01]MDB9311553.1 hypothetical protein [Spirulina sp. CS-785/01]